MTIKHLVLTGGGPTCIKALGVLQHLNENKFWNIDNIESIYATSGGAILAVLLCMRFEWSAITDYVLYRPWHEVYHISVNHIFDSYTRKGLFDGSIMEIFMKPFFQAKDLPMTMTLNEFFEHTHIELHMYTLELNEFEMVDVSYKTHPDLLLMTAIHMTGALPIVIAPVCIDNKCYIDGGVLSNYPLRYCLDVVENKEEILGIKNNYDDDVGIDVNNESSILDYALKFINRLVTAVSDEKQQFMIPYEIVYSATSASFTYLHAATTSVDTRKELLEEGIRAGTAFLTRLNAIDSCEDDPLFILDEDDEEVGLNNDVTQINNRI